MNKRLTTAILKAGAIAGCLDILLAFADAWWSGGIAPGQVLRYIASGVLGSSAFTGPASILLLGLIAHFLIAYFWTVFFFLTYPKWNKIIPVKFLQAVAFAMVVWLVMNLLVVPASDAPQLEIQWKTAIKSVVILIVAIAYPLALMARMYYYNGKK